MGSAMHCYAVESYGRQSSFFFGEYLSAYYSTPIPVSLEQCKQVIKRQRAPNNKPMTRIHDSLFGTTNKLNVYWSYAYDIEDTVINYYYTSVQVLANNNDYSMFTAPLQDKCYG